mgnify:CR=1 FL=1
MDSPMDAVLERSLTCNIFLNVVFHAKKCRFKNLLLFWKLWRLFFSFSSFLVEFTRNARTVNNDTTNFLISLEIRLSLQTSIERLLIQFLDYGVLIDYLNQILFNEKAYICDISPKWKLSMSLYKYDEICHGKICWMSKNPF